MGISTPLLGLERSFLDPKTFMKRYASSYDAVPAEIFFRGGRKPADVVFIRDVGGRPQESSLRSVQFGS
jgi:hypothetical protein